MTALAAYETLHRSGADLPAVPFTPYSEQDDTAVVIKVRRQKIVEMTGYLDRDEALRAARRAD
jgi:hypothetical protein